jgi:lysylphosphatidylglycerol synthetase-like protein (DUF2156 family)
VGGVALVSGDPVGDTTAAPALLADFARYCHAHAWRVAVLGVAREHLAERDGPFARRILSVARWAHAIDE